MASQASTPRPRSRMRQLTAVALTLGTVGALAAAGPSGAVGGPPGGDHGFRERDLVSDQAGRAERRRLSPSWAARRPERRPVSATPTDP